MSVDIKKSGSKIVITGLNADEIVDNVSTFRYRWKASGALEFKLDGIVRTVALADLTIASATPADLTAYKAALIALFPEVNSGSGSTGTPDYGKASGMDIAWISGLSFHISAGTYNIAGIEYTYPGGDITLNAADVTNPRIDLLVADDSGGAGVGVVAKVTGTAAADPAEPDLDVNQIRLTAISIAAGATTPNVAQEIIRDEAAGGEWAITKTATTTDNYATNPKHGTISQRITAAANNTYIRYTAPVKKSKVVYNNLVMWIRNNATFNVNRSCTVKLKNGNTQVGNTLSITSYGYSKTLLSTWSLINIPMSAFAGADTFDVVEFAFTGTGGTVDVQFDWIQLQSGLGGSIAASTNPFIANIVDYGADATGTIDSTAAIKAAVATGRDVYVPKGTFKRLGITSIELAQGQTMFGDGYFSNIITTTVGSTATLATAMNIITLKNGYSTVRGIRFTGTGKTTYVFPWVTQNAIWVYSSYNKIEDCIFENLQGAGVNGVHPSLSPFYNNSIYNCNFFNNTCGTFNYAGSEYWKIHGGAWEGNDIAANEWGANTTYNQCVFRLNTKSVFASGNGGNSDHFSFTDCKINHSIGQGITVQNIVVCVRFTGCDIFSSTILVTESNRVIFDNCVLDTASTVTVTATTAKETVFQDGVEYANPGALTFTNSGTSAVITRRNQTT